MRVRVVVDLDDQSGMAEPFVFSNWPPAIDEEQRNKLTLLATTYALSHGLLYLPPADVPPPAPTSAIHAPLALFPAPFPRKLFENVQRLQHIYNVLYARIALDTAFLDTVMGAEGVAKVDDFTRQLWQSWKRLRDEGTPEPVHLGIFRSDYLLHAPHGSDEPVSLKQVEFNTISSSFGALSERVSGLHNYLLASTNYYGCSRHLTSDNLPPNKTTSTIVEGLATAHRAYGVKGAYILFVCQANERNVFDQRLVEYELLEKHGIHVIRQTFDGLFTSAIVSADRKLTVSSPLHAPPLEIAVIYFRAGYTPVDYPTPAHYAMREALSRSRAVSCPTLALQLAGGKKVQEVLTRPGVLEKFLLPVENKGRFGPEVFSEADVAAIRASWVEMWGLDDHDGVEKARTRSSTLVLKPQREGGGNNVYRSAIPEFLDKLSREERAAWIAMALIEPPESVGGYLVRAGGADTGAKKADVVSELGVFGWALFSGREAGVEERTGGWLVRTKGRESDEGGVAVGFSVLDSVLLVD
ncbi:hypothetical protein EW145_g2339 [Phellinidium pouzarii]|uniref:Glutathione synthetase n=1 Tax=Phellinidium pouzarii TaxID=167371 RepID=A0A4V3XDB0_9AGAM|nr:hypothetical protein EW145_g2339 [Phellinidium pouzarii]